MHHLCHSIVDIFRFVNVFIFCPNLQQVFAIVARVTCQFHYATTHFCDSPEEMMDMYVSKLNKTKQKKI